MTGFRKFFHREGAIDVTAPIQGESVERVLSMSAQRFLRLSRLAGHTIKTVEVLPARLGQKGFGEVRVVVRDSRPFASIKR
jgi:hypothetical protein